MWTKGKRSKWRIAERRFFDWTTLALLVSTAVDAAVVCIWALPISRVVCASAVACMRTLVVCERTPS